MSPLGVATPLTATGAAMAPANVLFGQAAIPDGVASTRSAKSPDEVPYALTWMRYDVAAVLDASTIDCISSTLPRLAATALSSGLATSVGAVGTS